MPLNMLSRILLRYPCVITAISCLLIAADTIESTYKLIRTSMFVTTVFPYTAQPPESSPPSSTEKIRCMKMDGSELTIALNTIRHKATVSILG